MDGISPNKGEIRMLYCIEVTKEFAEDSYVLHHNFEKEPTREEVLKFVTDQDEKYDDDYGKLVFYKVAD